MSGWADTITEHEIVAAMDDWLLPSGVNETVSGRALRALDLLNWKRPTGPEHAAGLAELRVLAARRRQRYLAQVQRRCADQGWWVPEGEPPLVDDQEADRTSWTWRLVRDGDERRQVTIAVAGTQLAARGDLRSLTVARVIATAGLSLAEGEAMRETPQRHRVVG